MDEVPESANDSFRKLARTLRGAIKQAERYVRYSGMLEVFLGPRWVRTATQLLYLLRLARSLLRHKSGAEFVKVHCVSLLLGAESVFRLWDAWLVG